MQTPDIRCGAQECGGARKASKMLLRFSQGIYWLAIIFAISLIVSAAALTLDVDKADGFELYAVAGLMVITAVTVWVVGRAIYRLAR
jgi:uncharacterized membrane protein